MSQHDVLALNANFENWKKERTSGITVEPFLYYSVEHITKLYNLTDDQVRYGITDRANDGGIDALYCLTSIAVGTEWSVPKAKNPSVLSKGIPPLKMQSQASEFT